MSSSILKDAENALSVRVVELKTSITKLSTQMQDAQAELKISERQLAELRKAIERSARPGTQRAGKGSRPTTTREPAEGSLVRAVLSTARQLHNEKAAITLSALAHRTRLSNNQVRGIVHDLVKRGYMEQGFQAGVYRMVPE
jgi:polyhydroxyalkanoate synthesis regulator phasin